MPRIQLYLKPDPSGSLFQFVRPGGVNESIPALWLWAYVDFMVHVRPGREAGKAAFPRCVVDTGSHLTLVPERIWRHFKRGAFVPLPFSTSVPQTQRAISLAGGTYPYELAELTFRLRDLVGGVMDVSVVAQLTHDAGALTIPMVLGLRGGVIDGRTLRGEPDATAPYGQLWTLESP